MTIQQERELDWMTGQRDAMKKLYDMEVEQHACTISVLEQTRVERDAGRTPIMTATLYVLHPDGSHTEATDNEVIREAANRIFRQSEAP